MLGPSRDLDASMLELLSTYMNGFIGNPYKEEPEYEVAVGIKSILKTVHRSVFSVVKNFNLLILSRNHQIFA